MTDSKKADAPSSQKSDGAKSDKNARLAEALRANLRKRKHQARARTATPLSDGSTRKQPDEP